MSTNIENLLNTIRDNASDRYRDTIPEATQNNIETIQAQMLASENVGVANEFMANLVDMLIKQDFITKSFNNPLKALKKSKKPIGNTVQEVYTNFIKAKQYDSTGAELLMRNLPDTKTIYHRLNRKDKYKITVGREELAKAFSSYDALGSYISQIISQLYNSAELDEFTLTKQLIKQALDNNAIKVVNIADPCISEANAKAFIKTVKIVSGDMVFPNSNNNSYNDVVTTDTNKLITFSRKNEQVLILSNATDVNLSIEVLASVFNMSVAEFNDTKKIVIDAFPDPSVRGALVDERFFQIYDDLVYASSFRNEEGLYDNYYLHVWQTLAYSILVNGVVFRIASDESDVNTTIDEFTITKTLKTGVTLSNRNTKAIEGGSYSTKVKGLVSGDTVTVTMGGTDITTTAYDSDTESIKIDKVTGALVITVA